MTQKRVLLTPQQRQQVAIEARTTRLTPRQLSARYNVSPQVIYDIFDAEGIPRMRNEGWRRMSTEKRAELEDILRSTGETDRVLGKKFGVTHQRVAQIRLKTGLPNARNPESLVYKARQEKARERKSRQLEQYAASRRGNEQRWLNRLRAIKDLWDQGALTPTIAESLGTTNAQIEQWMLFLRKKYPGELPLRRPYCPRKNKRIHAVAQ